MVENLTRKREPGPEDESSWDIVLLSKLIIGLPDKFPKASIVGGLALSETKKWIDEYSEIAIKDSSSGDVLETNFATAFVIPKNTEEIIGFMDEVERLIYETLGIDFLIDTVKLVDEKKLTPQRLLLRFNNPKEKGSIIHVLVDVSEIKKSNRFLVKIGGLTSKNSATLDRK
jgi:hypothetical protein